MKRLSLAIKVIVLTLAATLLISAPALASTAADQIQGGVNAAAGQSGSDSSTKTINNTLTTVLNVLSVFIGIIAVIMIMIGGYKYITSGGDSSKVSSAKSTLLYAIIGLVIVALSQTIAQFVLAKANDNTGSSGNGTGSVSQGAANSPH